jgi:CBS domain containing-hemolysin-like protein
LLAKVIFVLLLVAANGFFVAAEFALVKIRLSEIRTGAHAGSRAAKLVENIVAHLDAYLSACQLGITLASLGLGWVGEPLVARTLEPLFHAFGIPVQKVHYVAFPVAFATITFLHITLGEQVPKIMAIRRYKPISFAVSVPLAIFYKIFQPFIWVLNESSNLMLRMFGIHALVGHEGSHTEDELRLILMDAAGSGHLSVRERLIMENVLDLEEKTARSVMLPRNRIVFLDRSDAIEEQLRTAAESGHTRLPICDEDLEHVVGIVHVKDVFGRMAKSGRIEDLSTIAREVTYFPESMPLNKLMREFQRRRGMMALLVDEYGVVSGLITLENVIEELVGPIQDEFDSEIPLIIDKGKDVYEIDATCGIDVVRQRLGIQLASTTADTIGGAVIEALGRIPKAGEKIQIGSHGITVVTADPRTIHKMRVERTGSKSDSEPE